MVRRTLENASTQIESYVNGYVWTQDIVQDDNDGNDYKIFVP